MKTNRVITIICAMMNKKLEHDIPAMGSDMRATNSDMRAMEDPGMRATDSDMRAMVKCECLEVRGMYGVCGTYSRLPKYSRPISSKQ